MRKFLKRSLILVGIIFVMVGLVGCSQTGSDGGSTSGDLVLESLQAVSGTELEATFSNGETQSITDFTPKPLEVGEEERVSFVHQGISFSDTIKYVITVSGSLNNTSQKVMSTAADSSFTVDDIAKVVLFFGKNYKIADVKNGTFSITIEQESPGGIAFFDDNNNYTGYLSLSEGLDSIPTQAISEETGEIDLGEISFDEKRVGTPSEDPFATMNETEKSALVTAQSFFGAVLRSPDLMEFIVQKEDPKFNAKLYYEINTIPAYERQGDLVTYENCFNKESADYPGENYPIIAGHSLGLALNTGVSPENVYIDYPNLEKPVEAILENSQVNNYRFIGVGRDNTMRENSPVGSPVPKAGDYTVYFDNQQFTLKIPNLAEPTQENLVFITPKFHLSKNNNVSIIERISWEYRNKKGEIIDNPGKIIGEIRDDANFMIGIEMEDKNIQPIGEYSEESFLKMSQGDYVLEEEIVWDDPEGKEFRELTISYVDIYGIDYTLNFSKFDD